MNNHFDEPVYRRPLNREPDGNVILASSRKEPKPMTETTPAYVAMNPLAETIHEGNVIIERIQIAADHYAVCIATERTWSASLKDAEATYEAAETEVIAEIVILAQGKEGPLAGLAATSKAYDVSLNYERIKLRTGKLQRQWQSLERTRRNYESAQVELRQAETQFTTLRKVCELKTAVLKAASL